MRRGNQRARVGLAFIAPALLFVCGFVLYPLARLVRMSLTSASLFGGEKYVGWSNYVKAWNDDTFWHALLFTLKYTAFITPILIVGGFLLALLTVAPVRLARLTPTRVFLPVVIGIGRSSFLWVGLFDQQVCPVGQVLQ